MKDSIKKRILKRIEERLGRLETEGKVREVKRTQNLLILAAVTPAIHFTAASEVEIAKDIRGRTYQFPLGIKIKSDEADPEIVDDIVAEVQTIIESELQLEGLCIQIDGGTDNPFISAEDSETGGSILLYDITYRRKLGNPYETY